MGFGAKLIWWVRTGETPATGFLPYAVLFGSYHGITSMVVHRGVLRHALGRSAAGLLLGVSGAGILFIVLRWIGDQMLLPALGEEPNYPRDIGWGSFALDNVIYALIPITYGTLVFLLERQFVQQQERAELAYHRKLSELDMLRARMAPHFLFNTLNNLYALAERRDGTLGPALLDLSELMRYIAKQEAADVIVGEELDQVERYVTLQRLRYARPVHVAIEAAPDIRPLRLPSMVLLPLMENAFKHGDPCDDGMPVRMNVRKKGDRITITCTNRIGTPAHRDGPGTGCNNLRRRLQLLYGEEAGVFFGPVGDGSFKAELTFPVIA